MAVILTDDIIKCIFFNENDIIPIQISLKLVPRSPIDNKPAVVQVMAWHRTGWPSSLTHVCGIKGRCLLKKKNPPTLYNEYFHGLIPYGYGCSCIFVTEHSCCCHRCCCPVEGDSLKREGLIGSNLPDSSFLNYTTIRLISPSEPLETFWKEIAFPISSIVKPQLK